METSSGIEQNTNYKSRIMAEYSGMNCGAIDASPQDEAILLGDKKSLQKTYGGVIDQLVEFENQIKKAALKNKSPLVLKLYEIGDKIGICSINNIIDKQIKKLDTISSDLEKRIEEYKKATKTAHEESRNSELMKYKAQTFITRYDRMLETLQKEMEHVKEDAKAISERIKAGENTPELNERLIYAKQQLSDMNSDINLLNSKRTKMSAAIVMKQGTYQVYRANEILRRKILGALESKYCKVKVLQSQLEDLKELSKDRGLINAIKMLERTESDIEGPLDIAETLNEEMEGLCNTLTQTELEEAMPSTPNLKNLENLEKESQNTMYTRAQEIMSKDLSF